VRRLEKLEANRKWNVGILEEWNKGFLEDGASGFSMGRYKRMLLFCHAGLDPASRCGKRPNSTGCRIKSGMTISN
jgi:hypothetical protein